MALGFSCVTYPGPGPGGRQIDSTYGTSGSISDLLSRVDEIEESSTTYVSYAYNGLGRMVEADYEQPEIRLQYTNGDTDGDYEGLDRFGRVMDQQWYDYDGDVDVDRFLYDHDRVGNPTYRDIPSGLYASNDKDQYYEYDDLHRLLKTNKGTLTSTPYDIDDANADFRQKWGLDQLGNWADFQEDANGDNDFTDAGDLDQDRTSNDVNEITNIEEGGSQAAWVTPAYDDNGNMDQGPSPADGTVNHKYIYDAWNRLVEVTDNSDVTIATYEYDGMNRRIVTTDEVAAPDVDYDYFFNTAWQIAEVRKDDDADPLIEMVWHGPGVYIDAPAYRYYDANTDGTSDEQYFSFDANFNVTGIYDDTGTVLERYEYDSYGQVSILDADFSDDADGVSDYEQHILFAGYRHDVESGLYEVRNRFLHPTLGRWMQRDPLEFVDGSNVYEYVSAAPTRLADPLGTQAIPTNLPSRCQGFTPKGNYRSTHPAHVSCKRSLASWLPPAPGRCEGLADDIYSYCCQCANTTMAQKKACAQYHLAKHMPSCVQRVGKQRRSSPQDMECTVPVLPPAIPFVLMNQAPCLRDCCIQHDKCFIQHDCTQKSWFGWEGADCFACNKEVVACMLCNCLKDFDPILILAEGL